jgi:predicted nicotinamide N-methyase
MADGERPSGVAPATVAGYCVRAEEVCAGKLRLALLVVADLERYIDRDALLRETDAPEPPYWAHLWSASRALAQIVAERDDWKSKRVVELGCGVGLPAVLAAAKGAVVIATDRSREALAMTQANAELNGCQVVAVADDFRDSSLRGPFDFCLAADVTYDPSLQRALASFVAGHLAPQGEAWVVESVRTLDMGFPLACASNALAIEQRDQFVIEEGRQVPVRVSRVRRLHIS